MPSLHPVRAARLAMLLLALGVLGVGRLESRSPLMDRGLSIPDSLRGRSGQVRFRIVRPDSGDTQTVEPLERFLGSGALARPVILAVLDSLTAEPFHFATLLPFAAKQNGRVGVYQVGRWPGEGRRPLSERYRPPVGFIEVTEDEQSVPVSTHFTLGQFLTQDQRDVWPKVLLLDERLLDKLELIIAELRIAGYRADGLSVLSGFRTPQYNARGPNSGRSTESRHQYGDAADVMLDADGDGMMDDLTRDGRVDLHDAAAFAAIVDRVEARYPELVGGMGVYRAAPGHSPFVHVDARGERARWVAP